jgi:hypothetical protein
MSPHGVLPAVPTVFHDNGELDREGRCRAVDFMIDAGSHGRCILAKFSEQFALSGGKREVLTRQIPRHVAGRVPVIVTTGHYSTQVCGLRSRRAHETAQGSSQAGFRHRPVWIARVDRLMRRVSQLGTATTACDASFVVAAPGGVVAHSVRSGPRLRSAPARGRR